MVAHARQETNGQIDVDPDWLRSCRRWTCLNYRILDMAGMPHEDRGDIK
jgi:hypothetical protein